MVNQHFAPGELFRFQHLFGWFSEAWCCYVAKESTGSQKMYQVWNMYRWFLKFTLTKGNGTWIEQKTNFICFAFCDLRATVIHHLMFYLPDFDALNRPRWMTCQAQGRLGQAMHSHPLGCLGRGGTPSSSKKITFMMSLLYGFFMIFPWFSFR